MCELPANDPDSSEFAVDGEFSISVSLLANTNPIGEGTGKRGELNEDDDDESYSPEECLNKMRGDIHDLISLVDKIKQADPTIR